MIYLIRTRSSKVVKTKAITKTLIVTLFDNYNLGLQINQRFIIAMSPIYCRVLPFTLIIVIVLFFFLGGGGEETGRCFSLVGKHIILWDLNLQQKGASGFKEISIPILSIILLNLAFLG